MPNYPWKRFWCPRDGHINFDRDGYPSDPEAELGSYRQKDLKSFDQVEDKPCLVLLGEPGIGKTNTLDACKARLQHSLGPFLHRTLRQYDTGQYLVADLFHHPEVERWRQGEGPLTLLLDGLDESLIRLGTLTAILAQELQELDCRRLHLRIACRTAVWPESFGTKLEAIWGKNNVAVYELTPIRKRDVNDAAEIEGLDPVAFFAEIERVRAQSLAIKPVTLQFLFNVFRRDGALCDTEEELYRQGCRELCVDSEERREARLAPITTVDQRYAIASRIAAVTILCNRAAVWTAAAEAAAPSTDIASEALLAGHERANDRDFDVDQRAVAETLDTGLFTSRGAHRIGWAHQTYAEFLAAEYLRVHDLDLNRLLPLLTQTENGTTKVVPQLQELGARLSTMVPELFDRLLHLDPETLLRSDIATSGDARRQHLVAALLDGARRRELRAREMRETDRLQHLGHPQLANQLRPIIADHSRGIYELHLALTIAEACKLPGLDEELLGVALNRTLNIELRCLAVSCLSQSAAPPVRARLLELAVSADEDADDRVFGYSLSALWPECITADVLFERLHPPRNSQHIGMYDIFLGQILPRTLRPEHLPSALLWVMQQAGNELPSAMDRLQAHIIRLGWAHMDGPGVFPAVADAIFCHLMGNLGRLADDVRENGPLFSTDDDRRRRVIEYVVARLDGPRHESFYLRHGPDPLVTVGDFCWLVDRASEVVEPALASRYAQLAWWCYDIRNQTHTDRLLTQSTTCPALHAQFAAVIDPVQLDSDAARSQREMHRQMRDLDHTDEAPRRLEPPPRRRVALWLQRCENGEPQFWWCVARELSLTTESRHYEYFDQPDVTAFPGWQEADEATRDRIVAAAAQYLSSTDDGRATWLGTNSIHFPALAGYQAFRLLWDTRRDLVINLDAATWSRWFAALLEYPVNMQAAEIELYATQLLTHGRRTDPAAFFSSLEAVLRHEAASGYLAVLRRLKAILDSELTAALRDLPWAGAIPEPASLQIIDFLAEEGDSATTDRCLGLLTEPLAPHIGNADDFSTKAICAIAGHLDASRWPQLWAAFMSRSTLAERVIAHLSHRGRGQSVTERLTDAQVADLYIWIEQNHPYAEEARPRGVHSVDAEEMISMWRSQGVLNPLTRRGTRSACAELARIRDALPQLTWFPDVVQEAVRLMRANQWQPPTVPDLLRSVREAGSRIIQSGSDLLNVVVESLVRLQAALHGELPAVRDLWNHSAAEGWRPLTENEMSTRIARHLREDLHDRGIVIGREVEIRPGQETDIYVGAVREQGGVRDVASSIVETKGCWHRDVLTAMRTQLAERYLRDNQCAHGIYLVVWCACDDWDDGDHRKHSTPMLTVEHAREEFERQAQALSSEHRDIRAYVIDAGRRKP